MTKFLEVSRQRGRLNVISSTKTDAEWNSLNPVLKPGEIALSSDNRQMKIGDGTSTWKQLDYFSAEPVINEGIADQVLNAADTYVVGSALAFPPSRLQARASLRWRGWMTKTAAGVVAPVFNIRIGTGGVIGDTARVVLTSPRAQTAAADTGFFEILAMVRSNGATTVIEALLRLTHDLAATGFADQAMAMVRNNSASFSTAVDNLIAGLSINPGAAGVWTVKSVISELMDT